MWWRSPAQRAKRFCHISVERYRPWKTVNILKFRRQALHNFGGGAQHSVPSVACTGPLFCVSFLLVTCRGLQPGPVILSLSFMCLCCVQCLVIPHSASKKRRSCAIMRRVWLAKTRRARTPVHANARTVCHF